VERKRNGAPQIRDPGCFVSEKTGVPGLHHFVLRRARDTRLCLLHAFALGRAETSACQRRMFVNSSGTVTRAGFMKSIAHCAVMSATV
jgi:hypothetical protein